MENIELFANITPDELTAMKACFKPETRFFRKGETIMVYSSDLEYLCVLLKGKAHLYCMDSDGEYALLENYTAGDVFGEFFAMPYYGLGYAVEAETDCSIMFIRFSCIYGRCKNACSHHTQLTQNLFELSAKKAQALSMRINMISKKSVRKKLMAYFEFLSSKYASDSFEIDVTLSQLANYLCIDRTGMMRELKLMCDDGIISRDGRKISIL